MNPGDNGGDSGRPGRAVLDKLLTVYGRKPVRETLLDASLSCHALHLAHSNREGPIIAEIRQLAQDRGLPLKMHSRESLARISRNGRQDQGVALDVLCPAFGTLGDYLLHSATAGKRRLLALDGITNPQNLGMLIRSAAAGAIDGILIPRKGNASLGPLVIKASAGTVFHAPLLACDGLESGLALCREHGAEVCILSAEAGQSLFQHREADFSVYVLGNESEGVSGAARSLADRALSIPMRNGVESLNVAVTASLIAYATYFDR
ncbi:MAG: RNA methyltransferase [Halioglobus sp.]